MKHKFKVVQNEDRSIELKIVIKLSEKDQVTIFSNADDQSPRAAKDLRKGYRKHGLNWLLHLLRLYIHQGMFSDKENKK